MINIVITMTGTRLLDKKVAPQIVEKFRAQFVQMGKQQPLLKMMISEITVEGIEV